MKVDKSIFYEEKFHLASIREIALYNITHNKRHLDDVVILGKPGNSKLLSKKKTEV